MASEIPAWCDLDSLNAALIIAQEARKSRVINVEGVLLTMNHPAAPPAGRWRTVALMCNADLAGGILETFDIAPRQLVLTWQAAGGYWEPTWPELESDNA